MPAFDRPLAHIHRSANDSGREERLESDHAADDIDDGVDGTHLVKMNFVGSLVVDLALRQGEAEEGVDGLVLDEIGESARLDHGADLAKCPRVAPLVAVTVVRRRLAFVMVGGVQFDIELRGLNTRATALPARNVVPVEREPLERAAQVVDREAQVEQSADHHVAADSGERFEVNYPILSHLPRLCRWSSFNYGREFMGRPE